MTAIDGGCFVPQTNRNCYLKSAVLAIFLTKSSNMSDHFEANVVVAESPLLFADARKSRCGGEIVIRGPALELMTPVTRDAARHRLRVVCMTVRSMVAFSLARNNAIAQNQNVLLTSCQSHTVINVELEQQDWISDLVKSQNSERLRRLGGVEGVASALETDTKNGIQGDRESIARRRQIYGSNRIQKPPLEFKQIVLDTIIDPIIIILLLCAALSLGFSIMKHGSKGWPDGVGLFAAVFVVVAVTAYCKIWTRRQIFKLSRAGDYFTIDVIRNGEMRHISVFDVVVGDVICLKPGDQVPADALYMHGDSLQVEESNIAEAMGSQQLKDSKDPFLFSGSKVTSGSAQMLVTAVGINAARWQILSKLCYDANQKTPLETKLHKLAMIVAKAGFVVAFLLLVVLLIRYFTGNTYDDHGKPEFLAGNTRIPHICFDLIGILMTPLAIATTAIPEGLLLAVIIPIAYSTNRMAVAEKALVRNLSSWEEIGSTKVICTNERANLANQKLEVSRFWYGQDTLSSIAPNVRKLILQGVVSDNTEVSPGSSSESIEPAIRRWAFQPMDVEQTTSNCTILHEKGDPEGMLAKCSQYYDEYGHIKEITNEVREILKQKILEMKSKFHLCIGFSCSDMSDDLNDVISENFDPHVQKEECFTLIGVAGLSLTYSCPLEIKESVSDCQRAGVDIKLVTTSELPVARAIAFECGILHPNEDTEEQVVEGVDFQKYPKGKRLEISNKIRVMARATTLARRYLVEDLKENGHVVAFTGDGMGDATVLKAANVGLSLGIQGTNIAKENSDIIIINDSFESIATALRWGRGIYCKIQAYTHFQLTVSISSLVIDFVTAISAREPPNIKVVATISAGKAPFAALQVLWAKLIVGVLAALAITIEEPAEKLQQLPSVEKIEQFTRNIRWKNILGQALYPIITLLTINFKGESLFNMDPKVKDTVVFNIFVLWQLFTVFSTKRFEINIIKGMQREKLFWTIAGSIIFFQVVIVEALEKFASTKRLTWMQWAECIGVAVLGWPMGWLVNRINVPGYLAPAVSCTYI